MEESGNNIMETELQVWKVYIELFTDQCGYIGKEYTNNETGPERSSEQIEHTIKDMRTVKATDELPTEIIKLIKDNYLIKIVEHFNRIYKSGIVKK